MPLIDYECNKCKHTIEILKSFSVKSEKVPTKCPECKKGKMKKQFPNRGYFDIVGFCYMNEHGKHAWKKGKTPAQVAEILMDPKKNPY